jgi:hypothetical protein
MALVKLNNRGVRSATTFGSISALGEMRFIKKLTSDGSDDDLSFIDGTDDVVLDDTYKEYLFTFNNIHPETDNVEFSFQANASGGSGYNETVTSTMFYSYHDEGDGSQGIGYSTSGDQAQGTSFIKLGMSLGNDNDQSLSGTLHLFNPSSTVFVKHFIARCNYAHPSDYTEEDYKAGYFNTTSAIDEIQFKMSADEIQGGDICLYGIN